MSMIGRGAFEPPTCPSCGQWIGPLEAIGGLFGFGHRCAPLELTGADIAPPEPTSLFEPPPPFAYVVANGAIFSPPPPEPAKLSLATFLPTTPAQLMRMQRECALLNSGGTVTPDTPCSHGSFGYALHFLEWEGLAQKQMFSTGPAVTDWLFRFTLTPKGEAARAALLAPIERRGDRHAI